MPVKDAIDKAEQAIRAVVASGYTLCVYDDNSEPENALRLDALGAEPGIEVVHLSELTSHPSPNYRTVLIDAQRRAIAEKASLVIIESDVVIRPKTIDRLIEGQKTPAERPVGMVAAVTTDEQGNVNFPYEYARRWKADGECKKRLSFCCTLLTKELLRAYDFEKLVRRVYQSPVGPDRIYEYPAGLQPCAAYSPLQPSLETTQIYESDIVLLA